MKLKTYLQTLIKQELQKTPVVFFTAHQYPVLFCSEFLHHLKSVSPQTVTTFSMQTFDWQQFESMLRTSFLGQLQTIWLGDLSLLSAVQRKKVIQFLSEYNGPHKVMCFASQKELLAGTSAFIDLDEPLQKADLDTVFQYFYGTDAESFIKMVKQNYKTMSLDRVLLLAHYSSVLGGKTERFMQQWYEKIILPEESLFTLTQAFFARKRDLFFRSWIGLQDAYAGPFWTTFWSEQLWRAYHVVNFMKSNQLTQAKQMSYRLPFSFMQRDWKTVNVQELQRAHHFLYTVDRAVKLGGSLLGLETFYHKFLHKQF